MTKNPSRLLYSVLFFLIVISPVIQAQVNQAEIENLGPVEFINYEGPWSTRNDSLVDVRNIGYDLGVQVRNGQARPGNLGRYFVIHAADPASSGFDADIFGLGVDVAVDNIVYLRLIIQGYLEGAYSYSQSDAALLARYITIYNAVYRGDINYFSSKYKNVVIANLVREKAGISIRFDDWPGQTLMVIPLGIASAGPLSAVDTGPLTEPAVIDNLRQEPDMGLDDRRDMVDLMERQAEQATQASTTQQQTIAAEQQQVQQQQQQAQQEIATIAEERQQPGADQGALDERQQQAEQQLEQAEQRQQELEEQRQTAEQVQQGAEERAQAAQSEREAIQQDQQAQIREQDSSPAPAPIFGASILTPNASLGRLVIIDSNNGRLMRQSALNTINIRSVNFINGRLIAIAGEARGQGAIRLVEMNTTTLEMIKQGDDDISPNSLIWENGNEFYAITSTGGNFYIARFNVELEQLARSSMTVHPFARVMITGDYLITQRADGTAAFLNAGDLFERR
jgi:hypothetical protein